MNARGFRSSFIFVAPLSANDCTRVRSHFRSAIASVVQSPFLKFPFFEPRGAPGLNPPCRRQRLRPRTAGRWHGVQARVRAPQVGASLEFIVRVPTLFVWLYANFFDPPIYHEVRLFRDQGNQRGRSLRRFSELAKALDSKLASSL